MEKLKEKTKFFTKTKICALMLLVAIITNMFSPYSVLLQESQAATPAAGEPYYELSIRPIDDVNTVDEDNWTDETYYYYYDYYQGTVDTTDNYSGTRVVFIDLKVKGSSTVNGADINLKYDNSKLIPAQESYTGTGKNKKYFIQNATGFTNSNSKSNQDFATIGWGTQAINELYTDESRIRTGGAVAPGQQYISDGEVVGTFMFKLADGMTLDDLDTSTFSLVPATGLSEGLQIAYWPNGVQKSVVGSDYLKFDGFATSAKKTLTNIAIKTQPTKTEYYNTEKLDLTNGVLTATYSDNTTEDINMKDALTSGDLTLGATTANANKKTTLNYQGKTVDFSYYLLDSINVNKQLTKMNYEHGDTIDYTGGELNAVYKNASGVSKTKVLNIKDSIASKELTTSATQANVDKPTITYTYHYKTATMNLSITDPVTSISITKQPTTLTYNDGDTINLTGGQITPRTKSGKSLTAVDMTNNKVTVNKKVANINDVPVSSRWTIAGGDGLQAGNQTITVTYEGKTASFDIVVNDTIASVSISTQPNASNKYGTPANQLKFDGVVATVSTTGGGRFTVGADSLKIDTSKYNPNTLTEQQFSVSYGTETATNKIKLTLKNYATGVTVKFPTTQFNYNTTLDDVIEDATYVENYADGTKSIDKPIAKSMVSGYVQSPEASLFDTKHQYDENLTITTGEFTNNQIVTIKDILNNISIGTKPNKITFGYGETFTSNGGVINGNYASGAIAKISIGNSNVTLTEADGSPINMSPAASEFTNGKATKAIKVTYTENGKQYTTTYNIKIEDEVSKIEMVTNPKKEYKYKEPLSTANGTIKVTYKSTLTDTIKLEDATVTETSGEAFDNTILGTRNLTVTYGGKTTSYEVNVKDYVTGISITPNAITGTYNDELEALINENDIIYTVTYAKAGATSPRALTESMVAGYNKTSLTAQNLTVTYTDKDANSYTNGKTFTTTLGIKLDNNVAKITITPPTKAEYNHGDKIDLTGGKITVTYTDGTTKEEPITSAVITEKDGGALNMNPTISEYGKDNKLSKTLTLKYTAKNGVTGTTSYPITIVDTIQSVAIDTLPTKVKYNIKDTLDTTGGKLKITRATGKAETIDITKDMVSGFDSSKENTKLPLTISYTENGVTKTTTYTVSVEDPIASMTLKTTPKTEYKYGEPLDISNGVITIVRPSGPEDKQITKEMVTGYDPTKLGQQELTIKYGGQELKYKVNVKDYVKGIVLTPPAKTKYEYGESLDLTGGNIQKIMASGTATTPIALTDSRVKLSTFNPNKEGAQTINVAYEGFTEKFGVIVEDNLQSIKIKTEPTKTKYKYGEALDITGGQISSIKLSGKEENIDITTSMVSGYNPNKLGKQTITITYKGKTTQYSVEVEDYIKDIKLTNPNKLIYKVNEKMDLTGGKVTPVMASGIASPAIPMTNTDVTITGFDTTTVGAKIVKVSYKGISKTFGITVEDGYSEMKIKTLPTKTEYKYGESLDLTGGTIEITKDSGTKETINITKDMVSGYNSKKLGAQILTVTYQGLTQQFVVKVEDYIASLKIQKPTKIEYEYGEDIELNGGKVSIIMASGAISESTAMTGAMITGYNPKAEGTQTIKIEYKGLQGNFQVKVEDKIKGISVNTEPDKTEYKYGENLDITGATIDVVKSSGITTIPVTPNMISGFSATTPGTQIIKITYGGFTTKFVVKVSEKQEEPKQDDNKTEDNKDNGTKEDNTTNKNEEITKDNNSTKKNYVEIERNDVTENQEQPEKQQPEEEVKEPTITKENPTKVPETKPTETLGVKDEKAEEKGTKDNSSKQKASIICLISAILLLILLSSRRNVKVYVKENGEFVLGGLDKISKNNKYIDVDKYLDGDTYEKQVKIVLSDSISEKLDKDKIEIKHRGNKKNYKIKYEGKEIEIILK